MCNDICIQSQIAKNDRAKSAIVDSLYLNYFKVTDVVTGSGDLNQGTK